MAAALAVLAVLAAGGTAYARDRLQGPVQAEVVDVVDGDTLHLRVRVWLDQTLETRVRLDGIDAPERTGACPAERRLAEEARRALADLAADGPVTLTDIRHGKYAGRVVARVADARGRDVGQALLDARLARAYAGGRRAGWCDEVAGGAPAGGAVRPER